MAQERERPHPAPPQAVEYHSYLLRLRHVREGNRIIRQVYLRDIPSQEELYFRSLGELVEYLQVQGALPWEMAWDEADGVED